MKTGLALASLVSMVAAGCDLSASYKTLSATCTVSHSAGISDDCCDFAQALVTKTVNNLDAPPSEQDQAKMEQMCPTLVHSQPDGIKCTESVTGGGETACSLHVNAPGLSISCAIPEETTISSDCCDALQSTCDEKRDSLPQRIGQTMMMKCPSVMAWTQERMASLGPKPGEASTPKEKLDYAVKALPVGLSCTEDRRSGLSQTIINAILMRNNDAELESQPTASSPSLIPMIAVAGAAGVLGGLVAFFAASKASSKSQRAILISDDA